MLVSTLVGIAKFNLPVAFPWILKEVVDRVLAGQQSALGLGLGGLIATGIGVAVLHAVITYFRTRLADRLGNRIVLDVRRDLFAHLQRLPLPFFDRRQTGALASRLVTDVAMAKNLVNALGTNVFMELSVLLAITAVVFSMHGTLALIAYVTLPVYLVVHKVLGARLREGAARARASMDVVEGGLHETIGAIADVKGFVREAEQARQFEQRSRDHLALMQRNVHVFGLSLASNALLTRVPSLVVLYFGAEQVRSGSLTVGGLMAFWAYLEMIYSPLTRLGDLNVQLANSRAAVDRIFELLDAEPEAAGPPGAPALRVSRGELEFAGVQFAYRDDAPVLQGVDLTVPAGSSVALVGRSGAGKSTLVKLLLRFYEPTAGVIRIDGQSIGDVDLASVRRRVAIVPQDPVLFSGTIEENLRFGRPDADPDEVRSALERSGAAEFVDRLPDGLATWVGERGVTLSGGQRQRLAIARAFLVDAPILVLDEATSQLDPASEKLLGAALARLIQGRTAILIAHRLSTVRWADRVAVLDGGRCVQNGTHDELLREDPYRGLYRDPLAAIDGGG